MPVESTQHVNIEGSTRRKTMLYARLRYTLLLFERMRLVPRLHLRQSLRGRAEVPIVIRCCGVRQNHGSAADNTTRTASVLTVCFVLAFPRGPNVFCLVLGSLV